MVSAKIIRLSPEVFDLLMGCKEYESDSMNRVMMVLLDAYPKKHIQITRDESGFSMLICGKAMLIPNFAPVSKTIRVSPQVHDRISNLRLHPDESLNMVCYRLAVLKDVKHDNHIKMYVDYYEAVIMTHMHYLCAPFSELPFVFHDLYQQIQLGNGREFYIKLEDLYKQFEEAMNAMGPKDRARILLYTNERRKFIEGSLATLYYPRYDDL